MNTFDFSWLPTKRTCKCTSERLNCLSRSEISSISSTILNLQQKYRWREKHPARFIPQLPERYIKLFSHEGETVLDPFCGSGTTNVVAKQLHRNSIGIDINRKSVEVAKNRLKQTLLTKNNTKHLILEGDCRQILKNIPSSSIDLVVTSPPYFDVVDYEDDNPAQLGNIHDYNFFLECMNDAFKLIYKVLMPNRYFVVNTQDLYKKDVKCPIHADYINLCRQIGFEIININIYILNYSTGGRLVYGYPQAYYPKNDHEFILIFQKKI